MEETTMDVSHMSDKELRLAAIDAACNAFCSVEDSASTKGGPAALLADMAYNLICVLEGTYTPSPQETGGTKLSLVKK